MTPDLPLDLSPAVRDALGRGAPVVALESTIVTHGMPYPDNVSTARAVEAAVRGGGAVPATIAVLGGRIRVGLDDGEVEALGRARGVMKLSRADLAYAVAAGRDGSTTVAATMICAHLAGIRVFATGGIGGVHRGADATMDVSADLDELARTPVAVVCAGAKALLDLPRTLEVLETRGVPVVGYRTDRFPAFWSRDSGLPSPLRLDSAAEVAATIAAQRRLGLGGGVLVANPVPEADEIPAAEIAAHIEQAVAEAARNGVGGKAVTPFILARMLELTDGRSLRTNVALILNNARLAAEIAAAMAGRNEADLQIRQDDPAAAHVAGLLAFHLRDMRRSMPEHAFALDAAGLSAPGVTFWTAWRGEALLGFAALKRLDDRNGEVKSMRAAPAARGTGVGRALLAHVVAEARRRGYARLSLETGTGAPFAPAVSLYRSAGFVPCGAFAGYRPSPHNQFMALDLSP